MRKRLIATLLTAVCFAAIQDGHTGSQNQSDEIVIQRIRSGDIAAIIEAGKSGNRLFVPPLRDAISVDKRTDLAGAVRVALAKLGERDQLQEVWCRAITDDPKHGLYPSTDELETVGGWFAIQGLEKLLTPGSLVRWHRASEKDRNNDALSDPLPVAALKALPKVIPNPPKQFPEKEWNGQVKNWRDWVAAHNDDLRKLEPTGEGVDFSDKACRNGKPHKKP